MALPIIRNFGILASISWNSNQWVDQPTADDLKASKYDYVKDHAHMHESLNFGHEKFPTEDDGYFIGYTPMFNRPPDWDNSLNVNIVFFSSSDYRNSNRKTVVGFYGFPVFGEWFKRTAIHSLYQTYNDGNIKAFPENIIYFEKPIIIDNDKVQKENLLPASKKISQQGFNYLHSDNVYNLLALALKLNPANRKLKSFVEKFPLLIEVTKEASELEEFYEVVGESNADTLKGIAALEQKMKNEEPDIKQRISSYIERGAIANKVKELTDRKCLVCEAAGLPPHSFLKNNGNYYVETHHVELASTGRKGVLSLSNLITVCANHHRQLHYGDSELLENGENYFKFRIDADSVLIRKIRIEE